MGVALKYSYCTRAIDSMAYLALVRVVHSMLPAPAMNFGHRFWVLAALSLGPTVSTSFARFAYALILPAMRSELGLNYSQAGSLNTANALGYLVGAVLCTRYVSRLGNRRLFSSGLVVTVFALL